MSKLKDRWLMQFMNTSKRQLHKRVDLLYKLVMAQSYLNKFKFDKEASCRICKSDAMSELLIQFDTVCETVEDHKTFF